MLWHREPERLEEEDFLDMLGQPIKLMQALQGYYERSYTHSRRLTYLQNSRLESINELADLIIRHMHILARVGTLNEFQKMLDKLIDLEMQISDYQLTVIDSINQLLTESIEGIEGANGGG